MRPIAPTAKPGAGWAAPDLERARKLVAASGQAGARVVIHVPTFRARVGRYYARLLDELGFPDDVPGPVLLSI